MSFMPQQQSATRDDYIQILRSGEALSDSRREELINLLLSTSLAAPTAAARNVRLVQVGITIPDGESVKSNFPHIVEYKEALSAEEESCKWHQHKTKLTHISVQLLDDQGAPPHPHTSGLVRARSCLGPEFTRLPRVTGR